MKLEVPYYSQYLNVQDPIWNIRSCTGACVAMAFEYLTGKKIDILEFMKESSRLGGYNILNGMNHDYVISFFENEGLKSWRYKNEENKDTLDTIDSLVESLKNQNPVIVSINKFVLEQKKFHTVLLIGYEEDEQGQITHFYYHEPEATIVSVENDPAIGGAFRICDVETFKKSWRGRAIFVSK
jgi:hypothetical protein